MNRRDLDALRPQVLYPSLYIVAGAQLHQHEHDKGNRERRRDDDHKAPCKVSEHWPALLS